MKKVFLGLAFIATLGLMGCPKPVKKTEKEIAEIDAKERQDCFAACCAGGGGTANYDPQGTGYQMSDACDKAAADASQAARDGDQSKRSTNRDMPAELVLQNNPFEDNGRMHNAILDIYFTYEHPEDFNTELKSYNLSAFNKIFNVSKYKNIVYTNPEMVVQQMQENNFMEQVTQYANTPITDADILTYDVYVNEHCKEMRLDGKSKYERGVFLNSEINNILNNVSEAGLSFSEKAKLIYLSTYKYSLFYWNE